MICRRCARLVALRPSKLTQVRYSSGAPTTNPRGPSSGSHEGPPAATSTSAAQPFSTPLTPAPKKISVETRVQSSVPAGTPLKGLGYLKNKDTPLALEDDEYPAWLWEILEEKKDTDGATGTTGDAYAKSKKQRKLAAKAAKKAAKSNPESLLPKVPLHHQTVDLPTSDGPQGMVEAAGARKDLTQSMRHGRRKDIKEANFLKGMR